MSQWREQEKKSEAFTFDRIAKTTTLALQGKSTDHRNVADKEPPEQPPVSLKCCVSLVRDAFDDSIPSEEVKNMLPKFKYPLAIILYATAAVAFLFFFISGVLTQLALTYLAPSNRYDATVCNYIPTYNTGIFYASKKGVWGGDAKFKASDAQYYLSTSNYQLGGGNKEWYDVMLNGLLPQIQSVGKKMEKNNLAINLLYWMSWVIQGKDFAPKSASSTSAQQKASLVKKKTNSASTEVSAVSSSQRFTMVGDPKYVFNREKISGALLSKNGLCSLKPMVSWNMDAAVTIISFEMSKFKAIKSCTDALPPATVRAMGYDPAADGDIFSISIDMHTLSSVLSQALGIIDRSSLDQIEAQSITDPIYGADVTYWEDPLYPGMQPMACFSIANTTNANSTSTVLSATSTSICGIYLGSVVAFPHFNHAGNDTAIPSYCSCDKTIQKSSKCNLFRFLAGVIFWPKANMTADEIYHAGDYQPLVEMLAANGGESTNRDSYLPAFIGTADLNISTSESDFFSPLSMYNKTYLNKAFSFCETSRGGCSMLSVSYFDSDSRVDYTIDASYVQLSEASCKDTISIKIEDFINLANIPFTPLINSYIECQYTLLQVIPSQAGIAFGNVGVAVPFVVAIIIAISSLYTSLTGSAIRHPYGKPARDEFLSELAHVLLLQRDGKLQGYDEDEGIMSLPCIEALSAEMELADKMLKAREERKMKMKRHERRLARLKPLERRELELRYLRDTNTYATLTPTTDKVEHG